MYVQQFIQSFAGDESLALCRAMAIANGNQSLDHQTFTQDEAKRHIISYTQVPSFHQWEELFEALSGKTYLDIAAPPGLNPKSLDRIVKKWCEDAKLENYAHGKYRKT